MAKSLFCTVLFLMVTTFSAVDGRPVIPKDLVLYWSFDNPTVKGKAAKDILGTREGRLEGNPKASAGKFGQRLRIQVRSATLLHSSSHAHLFEYDGWLLKA